jgi:hypothetical protein
VDISLNTITSSKCITSNRDVISLAAKELLGMVDSGEIESQECPVTHRFASGCYLREIFMPKGTIIIGKIHATEHFNVLLKGDVTVITAEGSERIKAPHTFVSLAGTQKVVAIHEDCIWQTLHVTNSTDLEEIEKEVISIDYDGLAIDGLLNKYIEESL